MTTTDLVLKNIALTAFACQALEGETYNSLAIWCAEMQEQGVTLDTIKIKLKMSEDEMKKLYDTPSMPSAWRSAKSVLLSAIKFGVAYVEKGKAIGKSLLEERILIVKETGIAIIAAAHPVAKVAQALVKARVLLEKQQARDGDKYNAMLKPEVLAMMSILSTVTH